MKPEDLQRLSRAKLIEMVLVQQAQIETLQAMVTCLQEQVEEPRAEPHRPGGFDQPYTTQPDMLRECEPAARDALRHLSDVAYLSDSRLAKLIAGLCGQAPEGHTLQELLDRAIQRMKPAEAQRQQTREQRCYEILRMTYREKKRASEIAGALAISERQYYRELKAAIRAVADHVLGRLW